MQGNYIRISVSYCPGVENIEADRASRTFTDAGEWALNPALLEKLFREVGTS
jgi:hypothetical protein